MRLVIDCTYRDLEHELLTIVGGLKGVQNGRQLGTIELDYKIPSVNIVFLRKRIVSMHIARTGLTIDDGTDDLSYCC